MAIDVTASELGLLERLRASGVKAVEFDLEGRLSRVELVPITDTEIRAGILEKIAARSEDEQRMWDAMNEVERARAEKESEDALLYGGSS